MNARDAAVFINWAHRQRLVGKIRVPDAQPAEHITPLADDERWVQLPRCLHEPTLPMDLRLAGCLILVYGQPISRLVTLTSTNINQKAKSTYLTFHDHPVRLPPAVAQLLHEQIQSSSTASILGRSHRSREQWIFPGSEPGRPHSAHGLSRRLRRHGLAVEPAREAALMDLAGELPSPVLADLLGVGLQTAIKWSRLRAPNTLMISG